MAFPFHAPEGLYAIGQTWFSDKIITFIEQQTDADI